MRKERLAAFSDGVLAIIITIMVLELKAPEGADFAALCQIWPVLLSYVLSFVYIAIYWNNHHHLFYVTERVNGAVLWANMHLLFWLSLIPFGTRWIGEKPFASAPTAVYGGILFASAVAYWILQRAILNTQGRDSVLAAAVGKDIKGRLSPVLYVIAFLAAFVQPWIATGIFVLVALMWLIPDPRIERLAAGSPDETSERPKI